MQKKLKESKTSDTKSVKAEVDYFDDSDYPEEELSPRQWQCIELIIQGINHVDIAKQLNINTATISVWKSTNPHFKNALNRLKKSAQEAVENRIKVLSNKALNTIESALDDDTISIKVKLENAWRLMDFLNISLTDDGELNDDLKSNIKELINSKKKEKASDDFDKLLNELDFT